MTPPMALPMSFRVNATTLIVRDGQVLLSRWTTARRATWTLPGTEIARGDDPNVVAATFVTLETGYRARIVRLLRVASRVMPASRTTDKVKSHDRHILDFVFEGEIIGGELTGPTPGKTDTDEARWFAVDALPNHIVKGVTAALREAGHIE